MPRQDELEIIVVGPAAQVLRGAGIEVDERPCLSAACTELSPATAALVVGAGVGMDPELPVLLSWREREPSWSDLPIIVVGGEDESLEEALPGHLLPVDDDPDRLVAAIARARRLRHRQLLRRDRDHRDALSTLAHELRNPLAAITNAVYLLRHGGATPKVLDLLDRQVKHLVRVLEDVRDRSEH
jgi:signal transduction histidine kinase